MKGKKPRKSPGKRRGPVQSPHARTKASTSGTSILAAFKQKLQGSKFRWLNEQLYSSSSQSSCALLKQHPQYFEQYHEGYREQTKSWPVRPVDKAIQWLKR
jgi:ribosomal RNA-processing protein 8